jgi:hypothetical protein
MLFLEKTGVLIRWMAYLYLIQLYIEIVSAAIVNINIQAGVIELTPLFDSEVTLLRA